MKESSPQENHVEGVESVREEEREFLTNARAFAENIYNELGFSHLYSDLQIRLKIDGDTSRLGKLVSSYYDPNVDQIVLDYNPDKNHYGEVLGEEVLHRLRHQLVTGERIKNRQVEEFFGFLGRKIADRMIKNNSQSHALFGVIDDLGKRIQSPAEDARTVRLIRKHQKQYMADALEKKKDESTFIKGLVSEYKADQFKAMGKSIIDHARGYGWAINFDIDKVHDWETFLKFTNDEVTHRFFRDDPDYKGL